MTDETLDEAPEIDVEFFDNAILTQPGENLIDSVQKARTSKALQEFHSLVSWLRDYEGVVDHSVFVNACDKVARLACRETGVLRYPDSLGRLGYRTLDLAATLLRTYIPSDVMFGDLPGYFGGEEEPV